MEFESQQGQNFNSGSGVHQTSYPMGTRTLSLEVKQQGREADHSTSTSAKIKKTRIYTSAIPYAFMA
jgi:hypothetical protein